MLSPFLFAEVALRLVFMEIALRIFPFKTIARKIACSRRMHENLENIDRYAAWIERRLLRNPSCLRRSLACFSMAAPGTKLIIGVDDAFPKFRAHAWLESGEKVFSGAQDYRSYAVIYSVEKSASQRSKFSTL